MIDITCSNAQFDRIMDALVRYGLNANGRCVLGKNLTTCASAKTNFSLTCEQCLKKRVTHKKKG